MDLTTIVISANVVTQDQQHAARAVEVLARAIAGLALEGISVGLNMTQVDDDETAGE